MFMAARFALSFAEKGLVPDLMIRAGIRMLCAARLREIGANDDELAALSTEVLVRQLERFPVAVQTQSANQQHYEVPAAFFEKVLGPRMKYSGCLWEAGVTTLAQAEEAALRHSCQYADLYDGLDILELGCGWGSLTLWMAERYPASRILAVSNSASQREHIQRAATRRGLRNVEVVTQDMNYFDPGRTFDRVVSVEMFEHMRNWPTLFRRVHSWLRPGGSFYLHVFCHRNAAYLFESRDDTDWMSRNFFSGGIMPSDDLAMRVCHPLRLKERWTWDGTHYARTAEAWLRNLDANRDLLPDLARADGQGDPLPAGRHLGRWRIFFMSCAELFGYRRGREWWVSHYRFVRDDAVAGPLVGHD